jgi:serine protease inhibitor
VRYAAFEKDGTFFQTPMWMRGRMSPKELYPDETGFEVVELPYKGGDLSMVVIAPRSANGLAALEKMLNSTNLNAWVGKLQSRTVNVLLPKFKLTSSFDLGATLKALGMKRAFQEPGKDGSQFEGLTESKDPSELLYITKVLHKAFVEVNEKGTEAAAATAVIMGKMGGMPRIPFTPTFKADKPFLILIRDKQTGSILFMGRIMQPKTAS